MIANKARQYALLPLLLFAQLGAPKPKYGPAGAPRATPLALSSDYFRSPGHPAPDFWALIGYYVPQFSGSACSVAAVTMMLNAAKVSQPKSSDDKLITQQELLEEVTVEQWKQRLSLGGFFGSYGTTLDQLGRIVGAAFKAHGFEKAVVRVVHVPDTTPASKIALVQALQQNEASAKDFILANFNQQAFTDDANVGHFAPVGAYDSEKARVLILDPDRDYYEPYWISVDTFLAGMATLDRAAGANRGYIIVSVDN